MTLQGGAPRALTEDEPGWAARPVLARTVRAFALLVQVAVAVLIMRLAAASCPIPDPAAAGSCGWPR